MDEDSQSSGAVFDPTDYGTSPDVDVEMGCSEPEVEPDRRPWPQQYEFEWEWILIRENIAMAEEDWVRLAGAAMAIGRRPLATTAGGTHGLNQASPSCCVY